LIKRFNFPTPGRNGNYIDEETTATSSKQVKNDSLAPVIIGLLGGENNIEDVDACMTRLRVTVKDIHAVAGESEWKQNGALGLILKDKGVQAIYGPKADVLKSDIQDLLGA
ncbi:PTS transporter subunit IICB, partial [Priestia megaterium]